MERLPEFIGNHAFLVSLFIVIITFLIWDICSNMISGIKPLSPPEVTRLVNHENAALVDVRPNSDFASGHIINAKNIPSTELAANLETLNRYKRQTVIIYCNNGGQSSAQAKLLMKQGFEQVYYMKGGVIEWKNTQLPLVRKV